MDDDAFRLMTACRAGQPRERLCGIRGDRPRCLRLDEGQAAVPSGDHEIDFQPLLVAEEVKFSAPPGVHLQFDDFRGDVPFKNRPQEGGAGERPVVFYAEEMTCQTRVDEIDLRRLDEPFSEVFEVRWDQENLGRDFKDVKPPGNGGDGNAQRARKVGPVEDPAAPAGEKRQEPPEGGKIPDRCDRADVTLQVGLKIGAVPGTESGRAGDHFRKTALEQRDLPRLLDGEGEELEYGGAARHGLRDPSHQRSLLGPGEVPLPRSARVAVDPAPQEVEELWDVLDLVEDRGGTDFVEERPWILSEPRHEVRVLHQVVGGPGEQVPEEGRLAGPTWPGQDERRKSLRSLGQLGRDGARNVFHGENYKVLI